MKQFILSIAFTFIIGTSVSQNLVPNPSFENYVLLPCSWIGSAVQFNSSIQDWTCPTDGTTDLFSTLVATSCYANCYSTNGSAVGNESPRTGDVMSAILTYGAGCGFQPNYREYLQVQLTQPLVPGKTYYAEFYVSLGDYVDYASNNLGMYFSTTSTYLPTCFVLNYTPQINETNIITSQTGWTKVSGTFTASTNAQYLLIGNFYSNAATLSQSMGGPSVNARYFIDDVAVYEQQPVVINGFNSICMGDSVTLTASGASSYAWADSLTPSNILSTDSVFTFSPTSSSVIYLYTGNDTISFAISVYNPASLNIGSDTTLCNGDLLVLDASAVNASYFWNNGSTTSGILVDTSGLYYVQLQFSNGCTASDSIVVSFIPCNIPFIAIASSDTSFCEKQCIDFFDLSTNSPTSWQWLFPGGVPDTSSLQNPTNICYNNYGSFDVTLIACNAFGCDTLTITGMINEYTNPVDSIWLSNDTLYSLAAVSYQWYEASSGIITGATNSYYVITQPGSYYCIIQDSLGCIATSNILTITSIPDSHLTDTGDDISVFPNPSNGTFIVNIHNISLINAELKLYNSTGALVTMQIIQNDAMPFDMQQSSGVYWITVTSQEKIISKRIQIINTH